MDKTYYDISLFQGDSLTLQLTLLDDDGSAFNLAGYSARGQIRKNYNSTDVSATFTIAINVSDTAGLLGTLDISLTPIQTALLSRDRYVYDVELYTQDTSGTDITVNKVLHGTVTVTPEVTKV